MLLRRTKQLRAIAYILILWQSYQQNAEQQIRFFSMNRIRDSVTNIQADNNRHQDREQADYQFAIVYTCLELFVAAAMSTVCGNPLSARHSIASLCCAVCILIST